MAIVHLPVHLLLQQDTSSHTHCRRHRLNMVSVYYSATMGAARNGATGAAGWTYEMSSKIFTSKCHTKSPQPKPQRPPCNLLHVFVAKGLLKDDVFRHFEQEHVKCGGWCKFLQSWAI